MSGDGEAGNDLTEMRAELQTLGSRVSALENSLRLVLERSSGGGVPLGALERPEVRGGIPPQQSSGTHTLQAGKLTAAPAFRAAPVVASSVNEPPRSLESRVGSFFLNRIGVIAVLVGMALFLKLGVDRRWFTPPLQIGIGLLVAVGLVLWSERFRRRGFAAFSFSLKALGTSVAYLSFWAAYSVYALIAPGTAFAAMVVVTAANGVLAWLQDSELLAVYALAGGLATPALLSTGQNHELFLFSYLLLLNVGAVVLSAVRPWSRLILGAFVGTVLYVGMWWVAYYSLDAFALTGTFLLLFFLLFTAAPVLALHLGGRGGPTLGTAGAGRALSEFMVVGLPVMVHGFAFAAGWAWAGELHWIRPWIALGLAVSSLAVDLAMREMVPDPGGAAGAEGPAITGEKAAVAVGRGAAGDRFADVHFGLAILFVAVAAWFEFRTYEITLCWLAEAMVLGALVTLGHPHHHHPATAPDHVTPARTYATLMLAAASIHLVLLEWIDAPWGGVSPVFNVHFAVYVVGLAVLGATAWLCGRSMGLYRRALGGAAGLAGRTVEPGSLSFLAGYAVTAFNVIALVAGCVQIHLYWLQDELSQHDLHLRAAGPHTIGFSYSAWFMVYGALLMAAGFLRHSGLLRWQALGLLAFSIGKVFLVDASRLSLAYKVVSFLGLGALLLTISFAYQRDWLALRERN